MRSNASPPISLLGGFEELLPKGDLANRILGSTHVSKGSNPGLLGALPALGKLGVKRTIGEACRQAN